MQARQTLPAVHTAAAMSAFPVLPSLGVGSLDSYISYVNRVPMLSAAEEDNDDESAYAPIQWLADNTQEPTAMMAAAETDTLQGPKLDQALMALDERSRNIVQSRWLAMDAEGNGTKTLHDLASEYGISAERVRQIETSALKKLRGLLQAA